VAKLIIFSIVVVSFALPLYFAQRPAPRRALVSMQRWVFFLIVLWAYMCMHWYPILVPLQ
jgi:hypothetical protein